MRSGPFEPAALRAALASSEGLAAAADVHVVRAPGRVNLIGEHTDYNEGFVLPAAIDLETRIAFVPSGDRRVDLTLAADGSRAAFDLDRPGRMAASGAVTRRRAGGWIDYVAGVAWALREAGVTTRGIRGVVASTLPVSAGLSSSAALELAAAWALTEPADAGLDGMALARLCQRAEHEYVGVRCGLMDQAAAQLGRAGFAMLLDCRSLGVRHVALPLDRIQLVVCDTGSARRLEASLYNARRAECEAAVAILRRSDPAIRSLRDVTAVSLAGARDVLEPMAYRRAEHVVRENERVLATVSAIEAGDLRAVGRLFAASHDSLRDLYEVSSPELDAMVDIARSVPGVVATRMTGAGFGGCTVSIVERDAVESLRHAVLTRYPAATGLSPRVFPVETADGAGRLG